MNKTALSSFIVKLADIMVDLHKRGLGPLARDLSSVVVASKASRSCSVCLHNKMINTKGTCPGSKRVCESFVSVGRVIVEFVLASALFFVRKHLLFTVGEGKTLLSPSLDRRIVRFCYTRAMNLDEALLVSVNVYGLNSSYVDKVVRVRVNNYDTVEKNFENKYKAFCKVVNHLRGKVGVIFFEFKTSSRIILNYSLRCSNDYESSLFLILNFPKFNLGSYDAYTFKSLIMVCNKHSSNVFNSVVSKLDSSVKSVIDKMFESKTKRTSGKITPKTHPHYFTQDQYKLRLVNPIKPGSKVVYNPNYAPGKKTWYAKSIDPVTGRLVYHYTVEAMKMAGEEKYVALLKLADMLPKIRKRLEADLTGKDPRKRIFAAIVSLCERTGAFRIGNVKFEVDDVRGIRNLQVKHLTMNERKKTLIFKYLSKARIEQVVEVKVDDKLFKVIKDMVKGKGPDDYIFTHVRGRPVHADAVNDYLKNELGCPVSVHKFRTLKATKMAYDLLIEDKEKIFSKLKTEKEKIKAFRDVISKIQKTLGHVSPSITLNHYIDKSVIIEFKKRHGITKKLLAIEKAEAATREFVRYDISVPEDYTHFANFLAGKGIRNVVEG